MPLRRLPTAVNGGSPRRSDRTGRCSPTGRSTAAITTWGERELREWHAPRIEVLADERPDLLALETVPSLTEVRALLDVLRGSGMPAWLSVTPHLGALRTGEPLEAAFAAADGVDEIVAVGVNCCHPSEV